MRSRFVGVVLIATLGGLAGCGGGGTGTAAMPSADAPPGAAGRITVSSPAFADGGTVPGRYTCGGADVSPPLAFSGVPAHTAALVLLVEDRDAPGGTFTHWLVWNMDPRTRSLAADATPPGAAQGRNDFSKTGYSGPCPPPGKPHRYVFTVYAADRRLALKPNATAADVRSALSGHTLASGTLTARYGR
ncbi:MULTISPECIES: YbhB/YbcL family Raf kinase inhibitor-like protein [unclassified Streptomyces]|uniref:YbhB/YbcL family Raf kinase inhibitor-like protein n=1 Tax=unclassified Streptomyces TaxID=2593676 RepID=UPI0033E83755